jgi:hypothetical protein
VVRETSSVTDDRWRQVAEVPSVLVTVTMAQWKLQGGHKLRVAQAGGLLITDACLILAPGDSEEVLRLC